MTAKTIAALRKRLADRSSKSRPVLDDEGVTLRTPLIEVLLADQLELTAAAAVLPGDGPEQRQKLADLRRGATKALGRRPDPGVRTVAIHTADLQFLLDRIEDRGTGDEGEAQAAPGLDLADADE